MTELLKKAIEKAKSLPEDKQNLVATAMLEEIDSSKRWDELFAKTTDKQWQAMAEKVQKDIENGNTISPEEFFADSGNDST